MPHKNATAIERHIESALDRDALHRLVDDLGEGDEALVLLFKHDTECDCGSSTCQRMMVHTFPDTMNVFECVGRFQAYTTTRF